MLNRKNIIQERYFFYLVLVLNLLPVLLNKFVPTIDGAAHLYNSNIINNLLFDRDSVISTFFSLNNEPVPNWTGHIVLSFFNLFLPAFLAEKILLVSYLVMLPVAFRNLIKTVSPNNYLYCYLIFPFTYSFTFFMGFYNFLISIVFLLITINFWIKNQDALWSLKNIIKLSALIVLTYFSHVFVFALLLFFLGFNILAKSVNEINLNPDSIHKIRLKILKKYSILLLSSIIPLFLLFFYLNSRAYTDIVYISKSTLLDWLKNVRPYITLDTVEKSYQEIFTKILFYLLCINGLIAVYNRIDKSIKSLHNTDKLRLVSVVKNVFKIQDFWLFSSLFTLGLYFFLPDSFGSGSYISIRLSLIFFIFFIIWLSTQEFPRWFILFSIVLVLLCNFSLNISYIKVIGKLDKIAIACNKAADYILPNSIVISYEFTGDESFNHYSNYLGIDKPMVIMENYESSKDYFPTIWNESEMPPVFAGNVFSELPLTNKPLNFNFNKKAVIADYIFIFGHLHLSRNPQSKIVEKIISEYYVQVYDSEYCSLYKYQINNL